MINEYINRRVDKNSIIESEVRLMLLEHRKINHIKIYKNPIGKFVAMFNPPIKLVVFGSKNNYVYKIK